MADFAIYKVVLTKLDEAVSFGMLVNVVRAVGNSLRNMAGSISRGSRTVKRGVLNGLHPGPARARVLQEYGEKMSDLSLAEMMSVEATTETDVFEGRTETYGALGIYGGHFLGQALAAGLATVEEPKLAHSFHAYFLRRGDPTPSHIRYEVSRLRESKGSEARSIVAVQNGVAVFQMTAAFKHPEEGDAHQGTMPSVESPESLIAAREARGEEPFPFPMTTGGRVQMEWITSHFREFDPDREPILRLWKRIPGSEELDARARQRVLAFLSDGTLMFNSVLPHGTPFVTHRLTSLDQSVWFHRDVDPREWLLFDQRTSAAGDGRGMNHGEFYAADGGLVMTCAQESMLRTIPKDEG